MANNLAIGLVIGAALSSGFKGTFGSAKKSVENLGQAITKSQQNHQKLGAELGNLRQKQATLYAQMSRASTKGGLGLALMKSEYDKITQKISQVKSKQQEYTKAIEKSIQTQGKLKKAIGLQEVNNHFRETQKGKFTSHLVKGTAMLATGSSIIKTFMEQEEAANNLKISMMKADGSFGKFNEIGKIADQLGTDLPGTRKDFYKLAKAMKMQGVSDDTLINGGLKTSAKLNVLLDMDQEQGGEFFAKMMESHGLSEAELAASADDMQRAMFAAGMKKDDMYGAMTYYASKVRSMKLTGRENSQKIYAIEGLAAQQGLEGTSFGTNFSTMLERMSKGPQMIAEAKKGMKANARDILEKSKISFDFWDKKGNFKGIDGMVAELEKLEIIRKKFGDQAAEDVADAMFGIEGKRVATLLSQQGTKGLQDFLKKMKDQASLEERVAQKTKTLGAALESLGGAWESAVGNVGSVFAEDIKNFAKWLQETIEKYTPLIEQNKELIKSVAGAVAGFIGFKLAFSGIAVVISSIISPFLSLNTAFERFKALNASFKLWKTSKDFSAFGNTIRRTLGAMKSSAVTIFKSSWRGLSSIARGVASGFRFIARGALSIGKALGGALVRGVMMAGRAFMVLGRTFALLGRALLTNPIGLIITGIAVAAYLIYDNWGAIAPWFANLWTNITAYFQNFCTWVQGIWTGATEWVSSAWSGVSDYFGQLWNNITTFFSSGIGNITATILNWSPLSLFYQAFSGVLSWFGIDLPTKFTEFGSNLISGLVNGIRNAWDGAKEWVISLGQSIKGWFTGEMEIHSPSRVFKGYGVNMVEGLAIGMNNALPLAEKASDTLSDSMGIESSAQGGWLTHYQPLNRNTVTHHETTQNTGGIVVHFSPTIQLNGNQNHDAILNDLQQGLNMTLTDLKRLIIDTVNREADQYRRRAY